MEMLGPWTPEREAAYRDLGAQVASFAEGTRTAAGRERLALQRSVPEWMTDGRGRHPTTVRSRDRGRHPALARAGVRPA
jgi:hypothetical protein